MIRALDRKILRDLLQMKGQVIAISLVMACGVATLVLSMSAQASLEQAMLTYYERYRFGEVFAQLKRAPEAVRGRVEEIPGVNWVQTRVAASVTLDVPGFAEPVVGRLISVAGERPEDLNLLHLRLGRWLDPENPGEALITETFARAHRLQPGDSLSAVINGRLQRLRIVGLVLSPEYIYTIRPGELVPDDRRYGVLWVNQRMLAAAFDMEGAFNDVTLVLERGASEQEVIDRLDALLEPYGSVGAYGRANHPSHEFVANEVTQLRQMAFIVPSIFLAVAAFLMNVVISRLVATQRELIATLKAVGYQKPAIALHYLKLVTVMALLGAGLGLVFGHILGRALAEQYARFFHFPVFDFGLHMPAVVIAIGLSTAAAVAGTVGAVLGATRLPPAEAMRPLAPASFRPTLLERLGAQRLLSPAGRMVLRQLERRPGRALLSCLGMAMAVAIMVFGAFMEDSINYVMHRQFHMVQRQDLSVSFVEPTNQRAVHDLAHLPGATHVEPFGSLAVRLRSGHTSRRVGVMALPAEASLFRLLDVEDRPVSLPPEGLVLNESLADRLGVQAGDHVIMEVLEGQRPVLEVPVIGVIAEHTGLTAYMRLDAANRLMKRGPVISGAFMTADPAQMESLYDRLKHAPMIAGVNIKAATLQSFRDTIAENLMVMRAFNVAFACVIAFGVIYNSARIALSERSRELATLRVVGFTRREISMILLGELAVLVAIAIPIGLVLGRVLSGWSTVAFDTELFRIPLVIEPSTYGFAAVVALIAAVLSGLAVRRRLDRLDLIGVLKTRE